MLPTRSIFFVGMPYDSDMRIFEERCVDEYLRKNSRRGATQTKKEENR